MGFFAFYKNILRKRLYCPNQVFVYFFPGVSERELQDKDTRDFIYDFIDRHGGIEAALEEVENRNRTPAPAPPPRQSSIARPPPPSKVQATPPNKAPMDPPHRSHGRSAAPPPPPP